MSAAFTSGPWAVHPMRAYIVPQDHAERPIGGAEDAAYDLAHYAQEICAMHHPDPHRRESEVRANANLIAAAPDLYEALKQACEALEAAHREAVIAIREFDGGVVHCTRFSAAASKAAAALAKARGEQSL